MVETFQAPTTAGPIEQIEAIVRGIVEEQRLTPGAALAVSVNGRLAIDLVTGYADTQRARLLDHDARFPLFSGSKPFGAVALWQLALTFEGADHRWSKHPERSPLPVRPARTRSS
jgi:CubicO group peptidase (beta-lactamase class C family)